jgi:4-amino-4-deoxy-L-arabinose transferase-like glycosyltransferase
MNAARDDYRFHLFTAAFCSLALALRTYVIDDAFWLDEIWSYYLTQLMDSPWDAFSELRIDNNHLLNTLTMYWLGDQEYWVFYRLPSLLSGVAMVALMGYAARKLKVAPWLAMLLTTLSFPFIQYSTEARGYSVAAMLGLAAWLIYYPRLCNAKSLEPGWLVAFWIICALGLLAHLTFVFVPLALGLTWLANSVSDRQFNSEHLGRGLLVFVPPAVFLLWVYLVFYGQITPGGDDFSLQLAAKLLELSRYTLGVPAITVLEIAAGALIVALAAYGIWLLPAAQQRFFAMVITIPGLLLLAYQPDFFFARYLLVSLPFVYLLIALSLDTALRKSGPLRALAALLILTFVAGSTVHYLAYARLGKGGYPQAMTEMFDDAGTRNFTVGSDFDFRNKALVDFYARYHRNSGQLRYVKLAYESIEPTDYFIVHNYVPGHKPAETLTLQGGTYELMGIYRYAGLSGWSWYLYRYDE